MTNEIKELIDNIKKIIEENRKNDFNHIILQSTSMEQLLDYITNLQEKLNLYENPDDMTLFYMWLDEKAKDKMKELQEENERLKDLYRRTIEHLFKIGNDELARYFQAQINDCPSFVPQDLRGDE